MIKFKSFDLYWIISVCIALSSLASGAIIYVDDNAPGSNNGTSWAHAYRSLQSALNAATSGANIWVAAGTYKPSSSDPAVSFTLKNGVKLYGGFAGNEPSNYNLNHRDLENNVSLLYGLLGSNTYSYNIVYAGGLSEATVLDGFEIQGSVAQGSAAAQQCGGGIYCNNSSMVISNCRFTFNSALDKGGAIYVNGSNSPKIRNCQFMFNTGINGGGAIYVYGVNSNLEIVNCEFIFNMSHRYGAGLYLYNSSGTIANCAFGKNREYDAGYHSYGGGMMVHAYNNTWFYSMTIPVNIINCSFYGNSTNTAGGVYAQSDYAGFLGSTYLNLNILNSIIYNNPGGEIAQVQNGAGGITLNVQCCDVKGGYSGLGNFDTNPQFIDTYSDDSDYELDLRLKYYSPCLDRGDNAYVLSGYNDTDPDGHNRILDANRDGLAAVDIGAYEYVDGGPRTIFVNASAAGGDGLSWPQAFRYLQDALGAALPGDTVWIAKGSYQTDRGNGISAGDRNSNFLLKNNVKLYGGFAGYEDPATFDLNARDFTTNDTRLHGNIGSSAVSDNAYHVLQVAANAQAVVVDGFEIAGGNSSSASSPGDRGGGILINSNARVDIHNCIFVSNQADRDGGALYSYSGALLDIRNCVFENNYAHNYSGGAIYVNTINSASLILGCIFNDNQVGGSSYGGAAITNASASYSIINCVFLHNTAGYLGGGIYNHISSPDIINCTFNLNQAANGASIYNYNSSPHIYNSILWGNTATTSGLELENATGSAPVVTRCNVAGGYAGEGNIDANPGFIGATYRITRSSPCVDAGNNTLIPGDILQDIEGNPRYIDGDGDGNAIIDMGAFETSTRLHLFVNDNAAGNNDGANWTDAFTSLADALTLAEGGDTVWVAGGTYQTDFIAGANTGNKYLSFAIPNGLNLYGGFAGNEDPAGFDLSTRDFVTNETILTGEINDLNSIEDNALHVLKAENLSAATMLDGFTITGGYADDDESDNLWSRAEAVDCIARTRPC